MMAPARHLPPCRGPGRTQVLGNAAAVHQPQRQRHRTRHRLSGARVFTGETGLCSRLTRETLAGGSADGTVWLWNAVTQQATGTRLIDGHTSINAVAFSPNGTTLAAGSHDGSVRLWNAATHQPIGSPLTRQGGQITSVAFSPDGKTLASGSIDGSIRLWNVATPATTWPKQRTSCIIFAPWQEGPSPGPSGHDTCPV